MTIQELKTEADVLELLAKPAGVNMHHVRIHPEAARALLTINTANRPLSVTRVQSLVKNLKEGRWRLINNGIGIDSNGDLLDGQHRLQAVSDADTPAEFFLNTGLEPEARLVTDVGKSRTGADALAMAGFGRGRTHLAAAVGLLERYRTDTLEIPGRAGSSRKEQLPHDKLLELIRDMDNDALVWSDSEATSVYRIVGGNRSAWSAFLYLARRRDPYAAAAFATRLKTGENLRSGDPELTLRNTLARLDRTGYRNDWYLCLYLKAWNARQEGRKVQVLRFTAQESVPEVG